MIETKQEPPLVQRVRFGAIIGETKPILPDPGGWPGQPPSQSAFNESDKKTARDLQRFFLGVFLTVGLGLLFIGLCLA